MRQLNPELSIVTTASGRISRIARTVSRTRCRISGARGNTSATPATARSESGTRLETPCCAIYSPPIPKIRMRSPVRSRSASISAPPRASPDGSPATMKMSGPASSPSVMAPWSWPLLRHGDTNHEQTGLIGGADGFAAVDDQGHAGLRRNPLQARRGGEMDGPRPDRRAVDAPFLARLCRLDQHPARAVAAQFGAAPQQPIGAFDRLDAEHEPLLNHDRLTDIEGADRAGDTQTVLDIAASLRIRPATAKRPLRQKIIGSQQFLGAHDPKALALQLLDDRREQPVVAEPAIADSGEELGGAPIRAQRRQGGAAHAAGQHEIGHRVGVEQIERGPCRAEPTPSMRHAGNRRLIGFAFERYHENRASGCTATLDDAARQRAISGENAERAVSRHSGLWAGRSRVSNRRG